MSYDRIVVIGDLHGDFEIFIHSLRVFNLIDNNNKWIGKNTYLIQMGDILDGKRPNVNISKSFLNSPGEWQIIKLIIELDSQARISGGRVVSLLGNHDLYPHYFYNDKEFEKKYIKSVDSKYIKNTFGIERVKFYAPGKMGGKLFSRTRPLIIKINNILFIHGSITDSLIKSQKSTYIDIDKINNEVANWLFTGRKIPSYLKKMDDNNPLFSRRYSAIKNIKSRDCNEIKKQLSRFQNIDHVVVGHSVYKNINTTCDSMIIRTDVGLSRAFGGEIKDKKIELLEIIIDKNETKFNILSNNI